MLPRRYIHFRDAKAEPNEAFSHKAFLDQLVLAIDLGGFLAVLLDSRPCIRAPMGHDYVDLLSSFAIAQNRLCIGSACAESGRSPIPARRFPAREVYEVVK